MGTNQYIFDKIYNRHRWVWGSGTGSIPIFNKPFIRFANKFLAEHPDIKVVVDIGCGDHQIGRRLKLNGRKYVGCDVSKRILEKTKRKFSSVDKKFLCIDAATDKLPHGDLAILKDVLQHLCNQDIFQIISKLVDYRYIIIQNDIYDENSILRKRRENKDIRSGKIRPLNILKFPFNADGYSLVLEYTEGMRYIFNAVRRILLLASIQKGIFMNISSNRRYFLHVDMERPALPFRPGLPVRSIFKNMPNQKRVFIVHGWGATPESEWLPWLAKNLCERGFAVEVPEMPDTDNPKIEAWVGHLEKIVGECDENTFFVGHSIGCQAIMRYLDKLSNGEKAGGAVFVAGWFTPTGLESDEERFTASPWVTTPIDLEKVKTRAKKFIAIFSDNDPFVPAENWEIFSEKLGAEIIIEKNKGHFSDDDGVKELPVALEAVLKVARSAFAEASA